MKDSAAPDSISAGDAVIVRILGKADILEALDRQIELVDVPEWGGSVYVRGLSGKERDAFEQAVTIKQGSDYVANLNNFRAKLVVRAACDSEGNRIFTDQDVLALGEKSAVALQRIFKKAQVMSGLGEDEVEELTKELGETTSADSGSA